MEKQNCWTCGKQQIGGITLLGLCRGFKVDGKEQPPREIPAKTVDFGCLFWTLKIRKQKEELQQDLEKE